MRTAIALLALGCGLFAVTARAAPSLLPAVPSAADIAAIDQCIKDAKDNPSACLGRIEKPCQDTEAGQTTGGAMLCADRETAVWSTRAKTAAQAITAKLDPARLKLFQAADAAWMNYRSAACEYEASIYLGGSLAKVVAADCFLRETADRALDLEDDERDSINGE